MKLFWCARTRATRAVWLLEEAGLSYERVTIDLRDPASRSDPEFVAASPMGKVPALQDGAVCVADSAAIALYVADRYAPGVLAPEIGDAQRGRFLFWMFFAPGAIEPAMAEKMGGWETSRASHGWGDFDLMIETLETGLKPGPWLLGESFSAADVMVGSSAVFMRMFNVLPDSPLIHAYADRCLERPAYQKAMALNESG